MSSAAQVIANIENALHGVYFDDAPTDAAGVGARNKGPRCCALSCAKAACSACAPCPPTTAAGSIRARGAAGESSAVPCSSPIGGTALRIAIASLSPASARISLVFGIGLHIISLRAARDQHKVGDFRGGKGGLLLARRLRTDEDRAVPFLRSFQLQEVACGFEIDVIEVIPT